MAEEGVVLGDDGYVVHAFIEITIEDNETLASATPPLIIARSKSCIFILPTIVVVQD